MWGGSGEDTSTSVFPLSCQPPVPEDRETPHARPLGCRASAVVFPPGVSSKESSHRVALHPIPCARPRKAGHLPNQFSIPPRRGGT